MIRPIDYVRVVFSQMESAMDQARPLTHPAVRVLYRTADGGTKPYVRSIVSNENELG